MVHIFYFIGIFFIWRELRWILAPMEMTEEAKELDYHNKLNKGKEWDEYSEKYKSIIKSKVFLIVFLFWMFMGLFTFQWDVFLAFIVFNFVIIAPISKLTKYTYAYTLIHWVGSLIGLAFGVFVIINHYHLRISFYDTVMSFIK